MAETKPVYAGVRAYLEAFRVPPPYSVSGPPKLTTESAWRPRRGV